MNRMQVIAAMLLVLLLVSGVLACGAEDVIPVCQLPVLTTSAGQSADIMSVNIIADEAGLKYDYCDVPDLELISAGVGLAGAESGPGFHVESYTERELYPEGTPFKTVIMAIGASLKGMGASGLSVNDELQRLEKIINYCKEKEIFIIAVHIGGTSTRGAAGSDNEKMIDAVAPEADYIVVTRDGNKDGKFTKIAGEKDIPFTELNNALDLVGTLEAVFQLAAE